jgi:hypothetical protein
VVNFDPHGAQPHLGTHKEQFTMATNEGTISVERIATTLDRLGSCIVLTEEARKDLRRAAYIIRELRVSTEGTHINTDRIEALAYRMRAGDL